MLRRVVKVGVLVLSSLWVAVPVWSAAIPVVNASFESPVVGSGVFPAVPLVDGWTEFDLDALGSTNTGVFANTPEGSPDRVLNADGAQLAFLGSARGNALEQDLTAVYRPGCDYRLTVGIGLSGRFPPAVAEPVDNLELVLYYRVDGQAVDIVTLTLGATGLSYTELQDFALYLPTVQPGDAWAGQAIGVAIRAAGAPGGFWDLDNVRLAESLPAPGLGSAI